MRTRENFVARVFSLDSVGAFPCNHRVASHSADQINPPKEIMKSYTPKNPSSPAHSILAGLLAAAASFALAASAGAQGTVNNPISTFPVTVDGQFSGGVVAGVVVGEWSDVTPVAFFSSPGASAVPVALNDPTRNSLLYAALARDTPTADPSLYLMYDFLPGTGPITPGDIFASVSFPIHLPPAQGGGGGGRTNIAVLFQARGATNLADGVSGSFFDVFVDIDLDGRPDFSAAQLGIDGAAGFGPSTLSNSPHLLVELEVPLRIPANFGSPGGPLPGNGINPATGLYDPDPAFWGASGGGNGSGGGRPLAEGADLAPAEPGLQPASAGLFTINPNGSTTITPVPEPATSALLLAGLGIFAARRRRAA